MDGADETSCIAVVSAPSVFVKLRQILVRVEISRSIHLGASHNVATDR